MATTTRVDVQLASVCDAIPPARLLRRWAGAVLDAQSAAGAVCLRIVDEAESQQLNATYRGKPRPTNVLAFPDGADDPATGLRLLGDLAICAPLVRREAGEQGKAPVDHWAHLVVHGLLHLLGFDHAVDADAARMEQREIEILATLGVADPYHH